MKKESVLQKAGAGFVWRAIQLGGTKIIFLVRLLLLARILAPDDFGLVTVAVSAVGFMMSLTNFGMIEALVQRVEVREVEYNAAWTVNVTRAVLVGVVVFSAAPLVGMIFSSPESVPLVRVLSLQPLLDSLGSIKVARLTRELKFRPLATLKLIEAVVNITFSVAIAFHFGVWGLVVGSLAGSSSHLVLSYLVAPHSPRLHFAWSLTRPLVEFGRWIYVTSLVSMLGSNILKVAISRQLGPVELGLYYLATQIAFLPYEVAAQVVGSVAFPLFAQLQQDLTRAAKAFREIFCATAFALFPLCFLIIALASPLVHELLGPRWNGTAPIIQVLTLATVIGLLTDATVPVFQGLGRPSAVSIVEIVQSTVLAVLVWSLAGRFGVVGAAFAWVPAMTASLLLSLTLLKLLLRRPLSAMRGALAIVGLASLLGAGAAALVSRVVPSLAGLLLAAPLGVLTTYLLLWRLDSALKTGLFETVGLFLPRFFKTASADI